MKRILLIFGTRPEAIKIVPVIKKLKEEKLFDLKVCVTAQHRQMLDQVLNIFNITPDFDLNLMRDNQNLTGLTVEIVLKIKKVIEKVKPDLVLVQGDTTTTFISSLTAFYSRVKIGHIEAGLRTKDKYNPFPEELNRKLTSSLSDFHFAPTLRAKQNLLAEGVSEDKIFITGNTAIDTILMTIKKLNNHSITSNIFEKIKLKGERFILVTAHRRESFGEGFKNICLALAEIAKRNRDIEIVYPVHLNPNVQESVHTFLRKRERIHLVKPLDYLSFVTLMDKAYFILTDSGGIQEEAPSLGKPVLVMRKATERIEGIEAGTAKLVGTDKNSIVKETERLLHNKTTYKKMMRSINPYGDGRAAERITEILKQAVKSGVL